MMSFLHSETLQGKKKFEDDSTMGLKWFQTFRKHAISIQSGAVDMKSM